MLWAIRLLALGLAVSRGAARGNLASTLTHRVRMSKKVESSKPLVGILTGSPNDLPTVEKAKQTLEELGVPCEVRVLSAHRTPDLAVEYVRSAEKAGIEVFIACAGLANHLAGAVAAHTLLPVIGVPLAAGPLSGMDALLSTVQMPPGVPVATVAVDGTKNAGFLAARILSIKYPEIGERLAAAREKAREAYRKTSA
jgi:5-(carboxyamino)imidazole ribonucleotide mutase